jgi:hypothetical protein
MEKHELELVTSTCAMSYNELLHGCTRHINNLTGTGKYMVSFDLTDG